MSFDREQLPAPESYYADREGLNLTGSRSSPWRTTECRFHGGSDSLRIHLRSGAFVCMAGCGARGGDVLGYHRASHGLGFVEAAKDLGAWVNDDKPVVERRPTPISARDAITVLATEANAVAIAAGNVAQGIALTNEDRARLMTSARRILQITEYFA